MLAGFLLFLFFFSHLAGNETFLCSEGERRFALHSFLSHPNSVAFTPQTDGGSEGANGGEEGVSPSF